MTFQLTGQLAEGLDTWKVTQIYLLRQESVTIYWMHKGLHTTAGSTKLKGKAKSKVMLQWMHSMCKSYSKAVVYFIHASSVLRKKSKLKTTARRRHVELCYDGSPTPSSGGRSGNPVCYTLAAPPRVSVSCQDGASVCLATLFSCLWITFTIKWSSD